MTLRHIRAERLTVPIDSPRLTARHDPDTLEWRVECELFAWTVTGEVLPSTTSPAYVVQWVVENLPLRQRQRVVGYRKVEWRRAHRVWSVQLWLKPQ